MTFSDCYRSTLANHGLTCNAVAVRAGRRVSGLYRALETGNAGGLTARSLRELLDLAPFTADERAALEELYLKGGDECSATP